MSISLNTYQTMISNFSGSKLGLDAYTRNLSSAMITAKMFSTIQKTTSTENRSLLSSVQNNLKAIADQSKMIKQREKYLTPESSSPDIKVLSSKPLADPIAVTVKRLATAQINQSSSVSASGPSPIAAKSFSFTLKTSEKNQSFSVDLEGARSGKEAFSKIADALNLSGSVRASLVENNDQVALKISHLKTGADNAFSFVGEDADTLGLNTVAEPSQDGSVEIDGKPRAQDTNTYADKALGLAFEAKAVTKEPVILSFALNAKALSKDFKTLTDALNQLASTYQSQGQSIVASKIKSGYALLKPQLDSLGVKLDSKGLRVDTEKLLSKLAQNPDASRTLSQFASISANALKSIDPAALLTNELKKTYGNSENTPYYLSNLGNIIDNNPYKGSLLDMLV